MQSGVVYFHDEKEVSLSSMVNYGRAVPDIPIVEFTTIDYFRN